MVCIKSAKPGQVYIKTSVDRVFMRGVFVSQSPENSIDQSASVQAHPAILVQGLHKSFGQVHALNGVQLEVPLGSALGFIGPNGAGKTTLIKILLGITAPGKGVVKVLGSSPSDAKIRKEIGYLPERLVLPRHLSPTRFLKQIAALKGVPANQIDQEIELRLNQVKLEPEAWKRKCVGFSKGMRQRTGLAAALIGNPKLLILDEPTDGIDPIGRSQIREVIQECTRAGTTVFLNSHLLHETERICDRVAVIHQGQITLQGAIHDLRSSDQYSVRFENQSDLINLASAAGFQLDPASTSESPLFVFQGNDASALSKAVHTVLGQGLILLEVTPKLKDLETVLREKVQEGHAS